MSVIPNQARATRPAVAATGVTPRPPGRLRWGIGILLVVGILINYFDRVNLSVAGPALSNEFHLSPG
jgi:ACS family D-galactonate transporter-like MFS transporter